MSQRPLPLLASALSLAVATALAGCATTPGTPTPATPTASAMPEPAANPFFAPSPLQWQYPQFDRFRDADFAPAFERGMQEQRAEIDAIAGNPQPASFDNTILAMERSGQTLGRASAVFFNLSSADTNDAREKIRSDYAAKFSAHRDAIYLNDRLFARVNAIHAQRHQLGLDAEGLRLVEKYHEDFVRAGANLSAEQKERIKAINSEMATLATRFSQNVLAEVNDSAILVDRREELAGLSDAQIQGLANAARAKGKEGKFLIALLNSTGQPLLAQLENRALRERIMRASLARGSRGNQWDNRGIVSRVAKLRAERAAIMGYPNYAAFALEDQTAKTPQAVNAMLAKLAPAAVANARTEGAKLQAMIDREQKAKGQPSFKLEPWDWAYYTEKVRKAEYDFDENQLKPYLEMNNVIEKGIFKFVGDFYGVTFKPRPDLPTYHPDVKTYEAFNADGSPLALVLVDPFARPSKRGGAWMSSYVDQSRLLGNKPVVAFHLNVTKPSDGQPALMTWDDVNTAFHEFGHVLHGMFSDVNYPYFSGTSVPRDFVEFPSQVHEMGATWPSVLQSYAVHWQTGERMPQALLDKVEAAAQFNEGFRTTEYLGAALIDQALHQEPADRLPDAEGVLPYEAATLKRVGLDYAAVPPRYRTNYFSHIMGGYAAGYYAYIWSEVLDATTVAWIKRNGGLTRENGDRFRRTLLSRGGSKDAMELFRDFSGGVPEIKYLLERRGLNAPAPKPKR